MSKTIDIAVIGGGAAGFFTAINAARLQPGLRIVIFEKGREVLSKLRISGGGRCNVTHHCFEPEQLAASYPRGSRMLRWNFEAFQPEDTIEWFRERGVKLKAEEDGRMFPVTDSSETIVNCLTREAEKFRVNVRTCTAVKSVEPTSQGSFLVHLKGEKAVRASRVVIAAGGFSREASYGWIKQLGHTIRTPVPSLFTFNFRDKIFADLAGISIEDAAVSISGLNYAERGPVLITHWGLSGPAILKLSSFAARDLHQMEYRFEIEVNWLGKRDEQSVRLQLISFREEHPRQKMQKQNLFPFPSRLWIRFLELAGIDPGQRWADLSNKEIHNLLQKLLRGTYSIQGKSTYKEEFVTCGGVDLGEVNPGTLESRIIPGLYFTGEILDIDGITGGFNFQAAWTNSWLAAHDLAAAF
ncbi:MAG TPA: NAD(P)/FAD-dependent oxidoreductase [Balneolaceae bacterium]|nr:NAD(P)/FAD-dependent oxidoreductase [Balneolaceae bacterium]